MAAVALVAGSMTLAASAGGQTKASSKDSLGASPADSSRAATSVSTQRPLAILLSKRVLVLPVQRRTFRDSLKWESRMPPASEYLASVDDELTFALTERGLADEWILPPAIIAAAKRNSALGVNPRALGVDQLFALFPDKWQLLDPLAKQLRSLVAINEARYVLLPLELRFSNAKTPGMVEPSLRLMIIDARRAQVQWTGQIVGAPTNKLSPAIAADLMSRFGELIGPAQ